MENQSGGFEIRVASNQYSFKSALIKRDITIIQGSSAKRTKVNVFEGMTDFLSLLVMLNVSNLSGDSIIMHSLSSFQRTIEAIKAKGYETINTFLDNNPSGKTYTHKFKEEFGEQAIAQNAIFDPYEDLNDALMANKLAQ